MTDADTTQENKPKEQQTSHIKEETGENVAQQLPNTDPETRGANDWSKQGWNTDEWGVYNYYN